MKLLSWRLHRPQFIAFRFSSKPLQAAMLSVVVSMDLTRYESTWHGLLDPHLHWTQIGLFLRILCCRSICSSNATKLSTWSVNCVVSFQKLAWKWRTLCWDLPCNYRTKNIQKWWIKLPSIHCHEQKDVVQHLNPTTIELSLSRVG